MLQKCVKHQIILGIKVFVISDINLSIRITPVPQLHFFNPFLLFLKFVLVIVLLYYFPVPIASLFYFKTSLGKPLHFTL